MVVILEMVVNEHMFKRGGGFIEIDTDDFGNRLRFEDHRRQPGCKCGSSVVFPAEMFEICQRGVLKIGFNQVVVNKIGSRIPVQSQDDKPYIAGRQPEG